jgi:hypothetical protein
MLNYVKSMVLNIPQQKIMKIMRKKQREDEHETGCPEGY